MYPIRPTQLTDYQQSISLPFSGKEKDSESGYYYFGARYFMPNLSIWNSVDPMADKYPSLSPYNYCAWNPLKLVDPNGEDVADFYDLNGYWIGTDGINDGRIYLVTDETDVSKILANGENCEIQTTPVSNVKSAIELPSVGLREAMLSKLIENDNANPYREYGGIVVGENNQKTTQIQELLTQTGSNIFFFFFPS